MTFAEKLKGLLERSTPRPWTVDILYGDANDIPNAIAQIPEILTAETVDGDFPTVKDADLIVALVNAAPALVRLMEGIRDDECPCCATHSCESFRRYVKDALVELDREASR